MLEANLNIFDVIVMGVLLLSALLSFFRGFLREIFSLGTWAGASVITLYAYPSVASYLAHKLNNPLVANGFASMGTFLAALLCLSIFGTIILKYLKPGNEVGMVDNTLGLMFGAARGVLLVAIGFYIMSLFLLPEDYPPWVQEAATKPYVEEVATLIGNIAPAYIAEIAPKAGDPILGEAIKAMTPDVDAGDSALDYHGDTNTDDTGKDSVTWPGMEELRDTIANENNPDAQAAPDAQ
jgi:membrane protein required for colicin V production